MEENKTWEELVKDHESIVGKPKSIIYRDWFDEGVRCLIMSGGASLCAYIGVPINHPLAGFDYDNLAIDCHGGLTFSGEGDGKIWPQGYWWYGWDYAHSGDYSFYNDSPYLKGKYDHSDEKKWLVEDVAKDMWSAIYDFKRQMRFAEQISQRAKISKNSLTPNQTEER